GTKRSAARDRTHVRTGTLRRPGMRDVALDRRAADRSEAGGLLRSLRKRGRTETCRDTGGHMKGHWQILVVDDEEVMCESPAAWVREDGYAVDTAASGREAVAKAREKDYAIYFVDLKMPGGMDGIETMMEV